MEIAPTYRRPLEPRSAHMQFSTLARAAALGACALVLWLLAPQAKAATLLDRACAAVQGCAATHVGLHIGSRHALPGMNDSNPGAYARNAAGYAAGAYYNSHERISVWAGRQFAADAGPLQAALLVGAVTGYYRPITPMVVPSVAATTGRLTTRLSYIPRNPTKTHSSAAMHLSAEWRL